MNADAQHKQFTQRIAHNAHISIVVVIMLFLLFLLFSLKKKKKKKKKIPVLFKSVVFHSRGRSARPDATAHCHTMCSSQLLLVLMSWVLSMMMMMLMKMAAVGALGQRGK